MSDEIDLPINVGEQTITLKVKKKLVEEPKSLEEALEKAREWQDKFNELEGDFSERAINTREYIEREVLGSSAHDKSDPKREALYYRVGVYLLEDLRRKGEQEILKEIQKFVGLLKGEVSPQEFDARLFEIEEYATTVREKIVERQAEFTMVRELCPDGCHSWKKKYIGEKNGKVPVKTTVYKEYDTQRRFTTSVEAGIPAIEQSIVSKIMEAENVSDGNRHIITQSLRAVLNKEFGTNLPYSPRGDIGPMKYTRYSLLLDEGKFDLTSFLNTLKEKFDVEEVSRREEGTILLEDEKGTRFKIKYSNGELKMLVRNPDPQIEKIINSLPLKKEDEEVRTEYLLREEVERDPTINKIETE